MEMRPGVESALHNIISGESVFDDGTLDIGPFNSLHDVLLLPWIVDVPDENSPALPGADYTQAASPSRSKKIFEASA